MVQYQKSEEPELEAADELLGDDGVRITNGVGDVVRGRSARLLLATVFLDALLASRLAFSNFIISSRASLGI